MFDDLAVQLVHCVPTRVAVIDDSIVLVERAGLLTCAETRQVLSCHQIRTKHMAVEAYLACGSRGDTDDIR